MLKHDRLKHASNIMLLHSFIKNEPVFIENQTAELKKTLTLLNQNVKKGRSKNYLMFVFSGMKE